MDILSYIWKNGIVSVLQRTDKSCLTVYPQGTFWVLVCSTPLLAPRIGLYTASLVSLTGVLIGWHASDCDAPPQLLRIQINMGNAAPSPTWRASTTWRKQKAFPLPGTIALWVLWKSREFPAFFRGREQSYARRHETWNSLSGHGPGQWEEALQCNALSHWPSPYPGWCLICEGEITEVMECLPIYATGMLHAMSCKNKQQYIKNLISSSSEIFILSVVNLALVGFPYPTLSVKTGLLAATETCLTFVTQQPFGIPYWNLETCIFVACTI